MNENLNPVAVLDAPKASAQRITSPPANSGQQQDEFWPWLRRGAPTALVLAFLAALAYWGHHSEWTIPKFSELFGGRQDAKTDWCEEHSVPESICVECNESLLPRGKSTWCRTHGVHDCPFEDPDVAQLKTVEKVTAEDLERAKRALDLKDRPENNPKCKKHHRRIQFASQEVMDKMGIDIVPVWQGPVVETVAASGEITFEQPRVAPISSPVFGRAWHVTDKGQIGAEVKRGDLLALLDAADVGKAKSEFLQALAQLDLKNKAVDNLRSLVPSGAVPQVKLLEAEAAQREAQIRLLGAQQALANLGLSVQIDQVKDLPPEKMAKHLQFLGIPEDLAKRLDAKTSSTNLFPVLAPRDGIVTSAKVVAGEVVDPSKTLFVVADTSRMWVMLNVRNEDVEYLRIRDAKIGTPGQTVRFRPDGRFQEITGELVWKSTTVDEKTRTVQFRAELPNPDGKLLANTFGVGQIVLREEKKAVVVPNEAVHWEGDCTIVFVRDKNFMEQGAPKVFHVRTVRPGVKNGPNTEIIAGLLPGEVIATRNSANLRAEMLKNNLGAG